MAGNKRSRLADQFRVDTAAPFQMWDNGIIYTEDCRGVLDFGEDYLRLQLGRRICTLFGSELEILSYRRGCLLLRGRLQSIEFG